MRDGASEEGVELSDSIAVIGLGNIGRRHLEGLQYLDYSPTIYLFDVSPAAAEACSDTVALLEERVGAQCVFCDSLDDLPPHLDTAIIATTSNVRAGIIEELLSRCDVDHLVLEKFLFDQLPDYARIQRLLADCGTGAWINCARRIYPSYSKLRDALIGAEIKSVDVWGGGWDMGCNGIHYLDLIQFLVRSPLSIDESRTVIYPFDKGSKRAGFREIEGVIVGSFDTGSFSVADLGRDLSPLVRITTNAHTIVVDERCQKAIWWNANGESDSCDFAIPFQSAISYIPVKDLRENGDCDLARYDESSALHEQFIHIVGPHFEALGYEPGYIPLT